MTGDLNVDFSNGLPPSLGGADGLSGVNAGRTGAPGLCTGIEAGAATAAAAGGWGA